MLTKEATTIVGGLSNTSKMPGKSYGIPAKECKIGAILRKKEGTTCNNCYALKNAYIWPVVQKAQYRRLNSLTDPLWTIAMITLISKLKEPYFRWHDSGDLQSVDHLKMIVKICNATPQVKHWLPTREIVMIKTFLKDGGVIPKNLCIRISSHFVDHKPFKVDKCQSSTVHKSKEPAGEECHAPSRQGKCGDCRLCWDKSTENVSYKLH